jgi:hypothetical protein
VVLSDGKPVPAGTRVIVSRQEAWDSQHVEVGKDGSFAFAGLPPEQYSLSARVTGYRVSAKNLSFDLLNPFGLLGMVTRDIDGLRLLCEAGPDDRRTGAWTREMQAEYDRRSAAPLRGAPE